jgi:hypothetical protein
MQAQATRRLTWARLVHLEPRLLDLLNQVRAIDPGDDPHFCANEIWSGAPGTFNLKRRMSALVGWDRQVVRRDELCSSDAYDVALNTLYNELPACRDCACM